MRFSKWVAAGVVIMGLYQSPAMAIEGIPIPLTAESTLASTLPLLKALGPAARAAAKSRKEYRDLLSGALEPKITALLKGELITAPAPDPSLCPTSSPAASEGTRAIPAEDLRITETETRETETREAETFWEELRSYAYEPVETPPADEREMETPEWMRETVVDRFWVPETTPIDLCIPKATMDSDQSELEQKFAELNTILLNLLKPASIDPQYAEAIDQYYPPGQKCFDGAGTCKFLLSGITTTTDIAEAYFSAFLTLYLEGSLTTQASATPACTAENLLEKDPFVPAILQKLHCLPDTEIIRLTTAFAKAMKMSLAIVDHVNPNYAEAAQKKLFQHYVPLMIALFDRTKVVGPANPLYAMLTFYNEMLHAQEYSQKYSDGSMTLVGDPAKGSTYLIPLKPENITLYNPTAQAMQTVAFCNQDDIDSLNTAMTKNGDLSYSLDNRMKDNLKYIKLYTQDDKSPKTIYGTPISPAIIYGALGLIKFPNSMSQSYKVPFDNCIYFPNFLTVLLSPYYLSDGSCPAWTSTLEGKKCSSTGIIIKWSGLTSTVTHDMVTRVLNVIQEGIISTAHAAPPMPKPKVFLCGETYENGSEPKCTVGQVLECDPVIAGKYECVGGTPTPDKSPPSKLSCEQICKYKHGLKLSGGQTKTVAGVCTVVTPLVDDETGITIVNKEGTCNSVDLFKLSNDTAQYNDCLKAGQCCGNGILEPSEQCDDGNPWFFDDCDNHCKVIESCTLECFKSHPFIQFQISIVDMGTPISYYRQQEEAYIESGLCKLPSNLTSTDGKIKLKQGDSCNVLNKDPFRAKLQQEVVEMIACKKVCKKSDDVKNNEKKAAFDLCATDKILECTISQDLVNQINQNGKCVLNKPFTDTANNILCNTGDSCFCKLKFAAYDCKKAQDQCMTAVIGKYGKPEINMQGLDCEEWQKQKPNATWKKSIKALNKLIIETSDITSDIQLKLDTIKSFKEEGAQKFEQLLPYVVGWLEYMVGETIPPETISHWKTTSLQILKDADWRKINGGEAEYDPNSHQIFWGSSMSTGSPENIANSGAHETIHAFIDQYLGAHKLGNGLMSPSGTLPPGMAGVKIAGDYMLESGELDHWIMQIIQQTIPGFDEEPLAWGGQTKDELCGF